MHPLKLATDAEPFLYKGGPQGCLILHGFTGTPHDVHALGLHLAGRGYTVLGPRLAHHATHPSDMTRSRWHDWYLSALDGWHMLRTQCSQVTVIGLSAGGVTALFMAAREPVAAVISISAPMMPLSDWRVRFTRLIAGVMPFFPKEDPGEMPDSQRLYTAYPVWPVGAVTELQAYLREADAALPEVNAPALLLHGREDEVAPPENLTYIYDRLGSAQKEKVWIDVNEHVITDGVRKEVVFQHVTHFLAEVMPPESTS
jgi:carboxylesterase